MISMRKLLSLAVASVAAALVGLLIKRLFVPSPVSPAIATVNPTASQADQSAPGGAPVSQRAVRSASRALPGSREQLYQEASRLQVRGRSRMNKRQLNEAVEAAMRGGDS